MQRAGLPTFKIGPVPIKFTGRGRWIACSAAFYIRRRGAWFAHSARWRADIAGKLLKAAMVKRGVVATEYCGWHARAGAQDPAAKRQKTGRTSKTLANNRSRTD
jgi:hypothetical protein